MIDTICLLIPKDKMSYISGLSSWDLYTETDQYEKYIRNPSKREKETGLYFPKLTAYKKHFSQEANIRMEFSASKLLYGNNLDELEDSDFLEVLATLQDRLKIMGVIISTEVLQNASVSSVHFSKNILLKDGYTASHLISEMNKVNLRKNFDFTKTKFMNDGQCLYAHTNSHQLVIYDKIADLNKDKKRAVDKDQSMYQRTLFGKITQTEIIRFEVRLNKKPKLNMVLEKMGYSKNPTLKDIFNAVISKTVIVDYWQKLIKGQNLGIFSISLTAKDALHALLLADSELKPKQAIYLLGLYVLAKDDNGIRQIRSIVSKRSNDRTWYRIASDLQKASNLICHNKVRNWVLQIDQTLEEFNSNKINNI